MGWLDFLFGGAQRGSNVEVVPDRIWLTADAKFSGIQRELAERAASETVAVLLVAHFPQVLERLEQIAHQHTGGAPVRAVLADNLDTDLAASLQVDASAVIDVLVAERHPLPQVDEQLRAFAQELPCRCRFTHHVSLDDAVMKVFAGEWVRGVLRNLGMTESEAIESEMVMRRIRQAQQKIEGQTFEQIEAQSAEEWLAKNCPNLSQS